MSHGILAPPIFVSATSWKRHGSYGLCTGATALRVHERPCASGTLLAHPPTTCVPQVFLAAALVMCGLLVMSQYITPTLREVPTLEPIEVVWLLSGVIVAVGAWALHTRACRPSSDWSSRSQPCGS